LEQDFCHRLVAALGYPGASEIAAAKVCAHRHAGRSVCDRGVDEARVAARQLVGGIAALARPLPHLGVAQIGEIGVVQLNVSAPCLTELLELFAIAGTDVAVESFEIGIGLTADGSTATAKVEHGWRRDCYLWHALCDRLEKLKICELDRVR